MKSSRADEEFARQVAQVAQDDYNRRHQLTPEQTQQYTQYRQQWNNDHAGGNAAGGGTPLTPDQYFHIT
jgi:hypothetical protein